MTKSLPQRKLGSSGIAVSAIGLGCMSLSGIYGKTGDDDGIAVIHEALDRGVTRSIALSKPTGEPCLPARKISIRVSD